VVISHHTLSTIVSGLDIDVNQVREIIREGRSVQVRISAFSAGYCVAPSKSEKDCYEKSVTRQLDGLFGESDASLIS
jgi:hypothetical protein